MEFFENIAQNGKSVVGVAGQAGKFDVRNLLRHVASAFVKLEFHTALEVHEIYVEFLRAVFIARRQNYGV